MKTVLITLLLSLAPLSTAIAQACSKHSPPHTVALLELYTSEGCSSCPPADRALSKLRSGGTGSAQGLGIDQVVPLSLHVDYWNDIGWKDVFSSRTYTDRQHWLSSLANSRTVYTPEMFVAGQELRNWSGAIANAVRRVNEQPARADIGITLGKIDSASLPVQITAQTRQGGKLYVALYENGLSTAVRAGENSGAVLHHDYVVRQWLGPIALSGKPGSEQAVVTRALAVPTGAATRQLGVAAFVQTDKGDVLQALALPLCGA